RWLRRVGRYQGIPESHSMFPARYHNALFVCDWSRGRILAIRTKPHGGTYKATAEVFLEGQPLNVTDLGVGPDGWLYFCTGGRETEGGVYRIVWDGKAPPDALKRAKGVAAALQQPQLNSAWARQRVALLRQKLGDQWAPQLTSVIEDVKSPVRQRARALDLMQLFGPYPATSILVDVSQDRSPELRAKAAYLMGLHVDESTERRLVKLLDDENLAVARAACEALARCRHQLPAEKLNRLLASSDRHVAWAAGRVLEQLPRDEWARMVLENSQPRVFLVGAVALLRKSPDRAAIDAVLNRGSELMKAYLSDDDFVDLLRVVELALLKGEISGDEVEGLRTQLSGEYPSRDNRMNRELVRLLVYLQDPTFAARLVEQLDGDLASVDKMQLAMHARFLQAGWTTPLKLQVLKAYEEARAIQGGHSFAGYVENVSRDFFATFDEDERQIVLAEGVKWPTSALSVLAKLPEHPSSETLAQIQQLDRQLRRVDGDAAKRLRIGICAVLGASGDPKAMNYLRELFDSEPDRRVSIAMGLAQRPDGQNWSYLIRALPIVEGSAAQEVLMRLAQVDQVPEQPEVLRQVILRGLMLRENGSRRAIELLEKWTGKQLGQPDDPWDKALAAWQEWFVETYPEAAEPKLAVDAEQNHWTFQELLSFLTGPQANQGVAARGAVLFEKAYCVKCHRFGERGDTVGPDLTNISKRFQRKEILESILFPSQVISDQYRTRTIVTKSGQTYVGMAAPTGDGTLVVLQANGEKAMIPEQDVEETTPNRVSSMPDGLLNALTLEDIADLFAYLGNPPRLEITRRPARLRERTQ
ncbi:MAG TPA: HEAT repeat domain-containing protein, partial [Pirellulales bacterium]|nr:HEAT repeat domain-containing protein [Pirellulales bacterium]